MAVLGSAVSAFSTPPERTGGTSLGRSRGDTGTTFSQRRNQAGPIVTLPGRVRRSVEDIDTVERALRLFLDALPQRLRFAQAAGDLGLTAEGLLKVYERSRINPREHLRTARLERLDEDLRTGRYRTLAEALVRWGFPPASTDALSDYHKRYGRSPQETLDAVLASRFDACGSGRRIPERR